MEDDEEAGSGRRRRSRASLDEGLLAQLIEDVRDIRTVMATKDDIAKLLPRELYDVYHKQAADDAHLGAVRITAIEARVDALSNDFHKSQLVQLTGIAQVQTSTMQSVSETRSEGLRQRIELDSRSVMLYGALILAILSPLISFALSHLTLR